MTERLINLRAWEASALNEGRATALVRVCKPQPVRGFAPESPPVLGRITSPHPKRGRFGVFLCRGLDTDFPEFDLLPCPFGAPGDVILGREAWDGNIDEPSYRATAIADGWLADEVAEHRWRSPVTMPRWAIRARYTNAGVRCMRVQDLTEHDAIDLGIFPHVRGGWHWLKHVPGNFNDWNQFGYTTAVNAYGALFESAHGPGAWSANPWVFFARLTK